MSEKKAWLTHYPESIAKELDIPNKPLGHILKETVEKYPAHNANVFFWKKD